MPSIEKAFNQFYQGAPMMHPQNELDQMDTFNKVTLGQHSEQEGNFDSLVTYNQIAEIPSELDLAKKQ